MNASPSFSLDVVTSIANECQKANQIIYNRNVLGYIGGDEQTKKHEDILDIIETCETFTIPHERDDYRQLSPYTDDPAMPDHRMHHVWKYKQVYDQTKLEFDIIRAQNAFKRARVAGA
jgi:hypothetical protein